MILLVVAAVILTAAGLRLSIPALRRHRLARELRRDWWPRFESEFRAYVNSRRGGAPHSGR